MNRKTLREKLSIYELTLFKLFVPNALSSICTLIIGVFDAVVSGFFIGPTALAAIGLASPFQNLNEGMPSLFRDMGSEESAHGTESQSRQCLVLNRK